MEAGLPLIPLPGLGSLHIPEGPSTSGDFFLPLSQILLMSAPGSAALLWGDRHQGVMWPLKFPKKTAKKKERERKKNIEKKEKKK